MRINHNIAALNTHRQLNSATTNQSKSMEKLASGMRINKAGDDAAGLAISEKMRGQIRGLDQAGKNAQDSISMIATAEGALNETHDILQRMRELAVQSATDTNTADDRTKIQSEVDELAKEITRISNTTEFNTKNLLAGGSNSTFQIGANKDQNLSMSIGGMDAQSLGVAGSITTTTFTGTNSLVTKLETTSSNLSGAFLNVSKTAATATAVSNGNVAGGAGTVGGTYTGSKDVTFMVEATGVTGVGGDIASAKYSTDGGDTWTNAAVAVSAGVSSVITLADGATLTVLADTDNAATDTLTFTQSAGYLTMQLGSSATGGTTVGTAQKVYSDQSSVTLGDSANDKTATVSFNYATVTAGATAGTYAATGGTFTNTDSDQITQAQTQSKTAIIGPNGSVSTGATVEKGINVSTQGSANNAITTINKAIETVSAERSKLGSVQNRLEHTINNLNTSSENLTAAESRIRDVDYAEAA